MSASKKPWRDPAPLPPRPFTPPVNSDLPSLYSGLPDRLVLPVSGPARRDDLPPCQTRCHGRKCGKRVAHQHDGVWRCISCGEVRT